MPLFLFHYSFFLDGLASIILQSGPGMTGSAKVPIDVPLLGQATSNPIETLDRFPPSTLVITGCCQGWSSGPLPVLLTLWGQEPFSRRGGCKKERVIVSRRRVEVRFFGFDALFASLPRESSILVSGQFA